MSKEESKIISQWLTKDAPPEYDEDDDFYYEEDPIVIFDWNPEGLQLRSGLDPTQAKELLIEGILSSEIVLEIVQVISL